MIHCMKKLDYVVTNASVYTQPNSDAERQPGHVTIPTEALYPNPWIIRQNSLNPQCVLKEPELTLCIGAIANRRGEVEEMMSLPDHLRGRLCVGRLSLTESLHDTLMNAANPEELTALSIDLDGSRLSAVRNMRPTVLFLNDYPAMIAPGILRLNYDGAVSLRAGAFGDTAGNMKPLPDGFNMTAEKVSPQNVRRPRAHVDGGYNPTVAVNGPIAIR